MNVTFAYEYSFILNFLANIIWFATGLTAGWILSNWFTNEMWKDAAYQQEYRIVGTHKYLVKKVPIIKI